MSQQDTIAVIGAGVIGSAVALRLARAGRRVLLIDRAEPGVAGASFGNAGHIAAEDLQPLASPGLLFGFYRELFALGGTLDLSPRQALRMLPWIQRFARAAFQREANTLHFAPLVRPAAAKWAQWLQEIGHSELLRRLGHYEVEFGERSVALMGGHARAMDRLGVKTRPMSAEQLLPIKRAANKPLAAGLWIEESAHVLDPLAAVRAFAAAAQAHGATFQRGEVRGLGARGEMIEIHSDQPVLRVAAAVICTGIHSQALLAPFGLRAPLQAVRGYHVELPGHAPVLEAPVVYSRERVIVTPMSGRLRATSYMEFKDEGAPADPRKPIQLRKKLRALGYRCEAEGPSWMGARPVLPDYLPGIGRAAGPGKLFYAIGHQHLGLTLAPITAELVEEMVAERTPQIPIAAFDLRRFGTRAP